MADGAEGTIGGDAEVPEVPEACALVLNKEDGLMWPQKRET